MTDNIRQAATRLLEALDIPPPSRLVRARFMVLADSESERLDEIAEAAEELRKAVEG
jgi:hypothetical protein